MTRILIAFKKVYREPGAFVCSALVALAVFSIIVWLTQYKLLASVIGSSAFSFAQKIKIVVLSYESFRTQFSGFEAVVVIASALLTAIDLTFAWQYVTRRMAMSRAVGISGVGLLSVILGLGCSACGSVLISTFLGVSASAVLLRTLPLHGFEFNLLGLALLIGSFISLSYQITAPEVCEPKKKTLHI